jgi:WW domain
MEKRPCRLPPSEHGEWWEISDESRGGIPYYYHTKTGETVWEKPEGFVIPLTVLQVRTSLVLVLPDFKLSPTRIPPSVAAFRSRFPQPPIRPHLHVQQDKSNIP